MNVREKRKGTVGLGERRLAKQFYIDSLPLLEGSCLYLSLVGGGLESIS